LKKLLPLLLIVLTGCAPRDDAMEEALKIRGKLLSSDCSFRCTVTADYGDTLETFTLDCESEADGDLEFTVAAPESIAGIEGNIDGGEGYLHFEDQVLAFPLLDHGTVSPICAPWILMDTLRRGCITSVARTEEGLLLSIDDSYAEDARSLEIRTDGEGRILAGEISVQGRRIVSMQIEEFTYE
jgi:hypothetical protein